jgi:tight adherence protein C
MQVVQREIEFGKSPEQALRDFAERSDLDVLRTLSTFVEQARRFGSSMAETLQTHADMLRTQREQRAEERAQKAAVKILFPTLLFIFPPILVVLAGPAAIQLQAKFSTSEEKLDETDKNRASH